MYSDIYFLDELDFYFLYLSFSLFLNTLTRYIEIANHLVNSQLISLYELTRYSEIVNHLVNSQLISLYCDKTSGDLQASSQRLALL